MLSGFPVVPRLHAHGTTNESSDSLGGILGGIWSASRRSLIWPATLWRNVSPEIGVGLRPRPDKFCCALIRFSLDELYRPARELQGIFSPSSEGSTSAWLSPLSPRPAARVELDGMEESPDNPYRPQIATGHSRRTRFAIRKVAGTAAYILAARAILGHSSWCHFLPGCWRCRLADLAEFPIWQRATCVAGIWCRLRVGWLVF